jgi:glutamyl/glutaminyl-tRNA synthetase
VSRKTGGTFVVRVEDAEAPVAEGAEEPLLADLAWLGLAWDEGPDVGGPYAPYRQSQRGASHAAALARLLEAGVAFPCFCSGSELVEGADTSDTRLPHGCSGGCHELDAEAIHLRLQSGEQPVWRYRMSDGAAVQFSDSVLGDVAVPATDIGEFALSGPGGRISGALATVADDIAIDVTFVVRGADELAAAAREMLIYAALGARPPRMAHLPLVTGANGVPLARAEDAPTVAALVAAGHLPASVVQYLAQMGWSDPAGRTLLGTAELVEAFTLDRVSSAAAVYDPARLAALTARHLHAMDRDDLIALARTVCPDVPAWLDLDGLMRHVQPDLTSVSDIGDVLEAISGSAMPDAAVTDMLRLPEGVRSVDIAIRALTAAPGDASGEQLEDEMLAAARAVRSSPELTLSAVRAALTGRAEGLGVAALLDVIPRSVCLVRLERALG